jgi:ribonuclease HI
LCFLLVTQFLNQKINSQRISNVELKMESKTFTLYFDGASKNNPGQSSCGWHIDSGVSNSNESIASGNRKLGIMTNNQAEYSGLIDGLKMANELGICTLVVCGDSKLVIEQMNKTWKINSTNLIPLWKQAQELSKKMSVEWKWIPRAENSKADSLANEALQA